MTTKKKPINALHGNWGLSGILPGLPEPGASYKGGWMLDKLLASYRLNPKALHMMSQACEAEKEPERIRRFSESGDLNWFDGPFLPPNSPQRIKLERQMVEVKIRLLRAELAKESQKEHNDGTPEAESGD